MKSLFPDTNLAGLRWISCISGPVNRVNAKLWARWEADMFWVEQPDSLPVLSDHGIPRDRVVLAEPSRNPPVEKARSFQRRAFSGLGIKPLTGSPTPFDLPRKASLDQDVSARRSGRLVELALGLIAGGNPPLRPPTGGRRNGSTAAFRSSGKRRSSPSLLCDFHMHSTFSDGVMPVRDLVDFYGSRGFDCISVTDHLADPSSLPGRLSNLSGMVMSASRLDEYFETLAREAKRAWAKYGLVLMTGIEFNKDGLTQKTSAHLLGVDLSDPIDPSLSIEETLLRIQAQNGLRIAPHPHVLRTEWGWNTLYLWENKRRYAPLLDAWEVANRRNLFNPVSLEGLPFVANSDLHQPSHIHSWKTRLECEKDRDAIKQCIRENRDVSICMYRDLASFAPQTPFDSVRRNSPSPPAPPAVPPARS